MRLADYVIQALAKNGIDRVALVYGSAIGDLVDAFTKPGAPSYWCPTHEQGAGFAMEGWAKVTGKIGCAMATSGPGGQNLVTPIGNAFYDSVPMLFLTGNVKTQYMRPNASIRQVGFQESPIADIVRPITKYSVMVTDPNEIRWHLEKALFLATHRRPGPVLIDLPIDVQKANIEPDLLRGFDAVAAIRTDASAPLQRVDNFVAEFVADLEKAERPAVIIGGGCRNARDTFWRTFLPLGIPCFPTYNGLDVVTSDFPWYGGRIGTYGGAGRNIAIQKADLLLTIGCRLSGRITGGKPSTFAPDAKKYMVDVDKDGLNPAFQQLPFDRALDCDAATFMNRLTAAISKPLEGHAIWRIGANSWRQQHDPVAAHTEPCKNVNLYRFMRELSRQAPDNAIIVSDCGGNWIVTAHAFETKRGQTLFTSNGNSPMGFSFAGALGAAMAAPDRPVICIIGDGGMAMNSQELQTMFNYQINVKVFILQNYVYGITRAYERTNFGGRTIACEAPDYAPPDFLAVAKAYGIGTARLDTEEQMPRWIENILTHDAGLITEVIAPAWDTYEPRVIGWNTPIDQMTPALEK